MAEQGAWANWWTGCWSSHCWVPGTTPPPGAGADLGRATATAADETAGEPGTPEDADPGTWADTDGDTATGDPANEV